MSNIREFTSRTKGDGTKFYSAPRGNGGEKRIDFRFADGDRTSLPYSHLVDVMYTVSHSGHNGQEVIGLDFTHVWMVVLVGSNMLPLYEALHSHDITWVRQSANGEEAEGEETFISKIQVTKLTDPALHWAALQAQKKALVGEP